MAIRTKRTIFTLVGLEDANELSSYYLRNANHLHPWEPVQSDDYNTLTDWKPRANIFTCESAQGRAYRYGVRLKNENTIIAIVNFTNVVHGVFQACHLGFSLEKNIKEKASCSRFYLL
ncbi:ribosomal-protein-alanine N-acetyltransferase [Bartonella callosciuri]|uniref:Ribosomal-protein-alanine N-acetyltransferase n=1 Tax=Bartonella callosciuri TaxID=686223 RepID=A0A840P1N2_9HYPH|nr:ribosomal-protein-alanine N-acetyltransferase [Bartonella callosciuri]